MSEWFYARGGQQSGPVNFDQLKEMARSGGLEAKDLVWTSSMKDWQPAGDVESLFEAAATVEIPTLNPSNPYAAPQSIWNAPTPQADTPLQEIVPGSDPLRARECVKRAFELTKRHFGIIILVGITYFGVSIGAGLIFGLLDSALGTGFAQGSWQSEGGRSLGHYEQSGLFSTVLSQVLSIFLSLGAIRIGLNLVSGKEVSVGMLFSEGQRLLPAIGASILFGVTMLIGLILLVVPGIYIALRFGQFMTAIVDRKMGVMESLSYSSSITTNNRLNILRLGLLAIAIFIAGLLALVVGLVFAYPVIWLSWIVAYRWMQYGHRAVEDHPGTTTPLLSGV